MLKAIGGLISLIIMLASANSWGGAITCGGPDRYATLDSAEACAFGAGNPKADTIAGHFGADPAWEDAGELTADGTNKYLTAELTFGSWGSKPVAGNWYIDSSFWSSFDSAVISMHVGNGQGDPAHFAWLITPEQTSGTWRYWISDLAIYSNGGGLSNFRLWGQRAVDVAEPASIALLMLGLVGLGISRRRVR